MEALNGAAHATGFWPLEVYQSLWVCHPPRFAQSLLDFVTIFVVYFTFILFFCSCNKKKKGGKVDLAQ